LGKCAQARRCVHFYTEKKLIIPILSGINLALAGLFVKINGFIRFFLRL
jgi:hypothetical protein